MRLRGISLLLPCVAAAPAQVRYHFGNDPHWAARDIAGRVHILSYERVDDLIVKPIEIRDTYALVSDRPGLAVELDEDAVHKYQVS